MQQYLSNMSSLCLDVVYAFQSKGFQTCQYLSFVAAMFSVWISDKMQILPT